MGWARYSVPPLAVMGAYLVRGRTHLLHIGLLTATSDGANICSIEQLFTQRLGIRGSMR
jgi:hypothetical protein